LLLQGSAFMHQPLLGRTAFAALHFMELLVGPRCQSLDVDNPKVCGKISFYGNCCSNSKISSDLPKLA
jgi:hypothetical protein